MASLPPPEAARELAQKTLQANKDHQYALKIYTERLEAELDAVDKLLVSLVTRSFVLKANMES